ncbi:RAQPRD family integrative conjugative element protein [Pseudomonas sp. NPDC089401]|uniref:integrative conjugative element protein, RAQPRD family n=1 Tax=Pseudomonas sp. NPDC089401 TaxID=3364462 RepID=UPI00380A8967
MKVNAPSHCALQWLLLSVLLIDGIGTLPASASDIERAQLATVLRQLDALERHADNSAALSHPIAARYHFDYLRLREDIQRIRSGVQDYLTPQRAQPRDLAPMLGEYVGEADAP